MSGIVDCCGLVKYYFPQFFLADEKIDSEEAARRIEIESEKWEQEDRSDIWGLLTARTFPASQQLQDSLKRFKKEGIDSGIAVDLGCGNSESATDLLQSGWRVIAIDSSKGALGHLQQRANRLNANWLKNGQLILKCKKMEDYCFPKNIHMVFASNSLMHCDPMKMSDLFKKINASLTKGGRFLGNFYIAPKDQLEKGLFRMALGAWFPDKAVVDRLLEDTGYQIETCAYDNNWFEPKLIEFVGQKL